ncbi:hypothetical protein K1720_10190 [Thermococcus argininiproducens]|uniref:Uncharacterized protein n=1 Tax=Thermococcus argininiproducens TaxID=2866384 RepID=A0A9E7MAC7_9EURY|nr:hypothetical protein [Thermococcus argininiproducens]USG99837.1 hypothetical protein K1720_10190 [Thermococcus argininiproducens]
MVGFEFSGDRFVVSLWEGADKDIIDALDNFVKKAFKESSRVLYLRARVSKDKDFKDEDDHPIYGFYIEVVCASERGYSGTVHMPKDYIELDPLLFYVEDNRKLVVSLDRSPDRQVDMELELPVEEVVIHVYRKISY